MSSPFDFLSALSPIPGDGNPGNSQETMSALTDAYKAAHIKRMAPVGGHNYAQATADLQLTPQERSLYERHLRNLNGPGGVDNPDGSRSTLYQANVEHDGKHYNIPTVYDGKILPWQDAAARAAAQGWKNFPAYNSPEEAEARYNQMHGYMDKDTGEHMANKGAYANARVARGFDQFGPQPSPPPAPMPPGGMYPNERVAQGFNAVGPTPMQTAMQTPSPLPGAPPPAPVPPAAPPVPMPTARPPEAPQAPDPMSFFQRNAAMMRDPSSGDFIDPTNAARAQASGPDVINKLLSFFHQKDA